MMVGGKTSKILLGYVGVFLMFGVFCSVNMADETVNAEAVSWEQRIEQILSFQKQGKYKEAVKQSQEWLLIAEKQVGPDTPTAVMFRYLLGESFFYSGDLARAEPILEHVLTTMERLRGKDSEILLATLMLLARIHDAKHDPAGSESFLKRILAIEEKSSGEHDIAGTLRDLAKLYRNERRYDEAESLYRRAISIEESRSGSDEELSLLRRDLALMFIEQERYSEAEALLKAVISFQETSNHPYLPSSLSFLALVYRFQGRYLEAVPLYKRSMHMAEAVFGSDYPQEVISVIKDYAIVLRKLGREDEAKSLESKIKSVN